ncbi:PLP-dependent cysteine synthase family protein [Heyndrickxia coagulans]|uniref:O-acetylserine dependent cystathionine beta-synthase n=1 Tax=Heyndrickxia coagulans DSM 1 = ATCC 7050 TaxID=1121088 RepID=A0A8B4BY64_HEYCO|nr:cysteine synthase family protein [Heyndrickxia coagulans]AJH79690.1 pyridoxal-phosphate dependent enzyme family protein [Heyndrickxia coagulans DSM 1 = ATCC 7050]MCR2846610.1 cysteine synthase family protein [Heyndrickxia coagulans]MDR4224309.1 cysteine synthase family protein [Heyndrickxia coagulans DSM 1 = ATCC 7050]MED4406126.1 cysteine synthase family protein [Heyndrickxia coagulans]MED4493904.1 cysteine synthase family protein [Heyndrickxia coagulans]
MKVAKSVHELIGNTPLVELTAFDLPKGVRLFAKLEYFNPGGSVKDRLGAYLIERAFQEGRLKRGGTIIEPTAGNTGIGLALAAIRYGVHAVFVVPEKFSVEKQTLMRALGAEVVNTPTALGMAGAIAEAKKLTAETPNAYFPGQFENPSNPETYYKTLGPEIWEALDGHIDVFVAGAGSGGTFMGTARYLKEKNPALKAAIVEPEGSILNGGEPRSHRTEGIGMEFLPPFMDRTFFDAIHTIPDDAAFKRLAEAARLEGLLIGSSSGAALEASLREAKQAKPGTHIVTIFPDSSERYLSRSIYS